MANENDATSLPPGRNQVALDDAQKRQVEQMFRTLGYQEAIEWRDGAGTRSAFNPGGDYPRIYVGADIFPGQAMNPNAMLDVISAVAHEIAHFNRWTNSWECREFLDLDEALTSLQAACWSKQYLNPSQVESLISDAIHRLGMLNEDLVEQKKQLSLRERENVLLREELTRLRESAPHG